MAHVVNVSYDILTVMTEQQGYDLIRSTHEQSVSALYHLARIVFELKKGARHNRESNPCSDGYNPNALTTLPLKYSTIRVRSIIDKHEACTCLLSVVSSSDWH